MTIRVTIKNEDAGRVVKVTEHTFDLSKGDTPLPTPYTEHTTLPAGHQREFYVHAAKHLIVTEDPDSLR